MHDEDKSKEQLIIELRELRERVAESEKSKHKRAEATLLESETRFRQLVELLPVAVYVCDKVGLILQYNQAAVALWGREPKIGEHDGERFCGSYKIYTPDGTRLPHEQCPMAETLRTREPIRNAEIIVERPDGSRVTAIVNTAPIKNIRGEFGGAINCLLDITERKWAEGERQRLMTAIEQTGEMIVITDAEGTIEFVNQAFERVTGYSTKEVVGQNPRIFKSGEHDEALYRNLWETISSGRTWEGRMVNKRKDGTLYTEEATISPVLDASGRIVNYAAVKRDITEEIRLEAQFLQAQKMESVGRLAGGVAHDFNNMLNVIIGYTEMALDKTNPEDDRYLDLQEIHKAARRSADLTRQLLAFARKQIVAPKVLNLNETVEGMLTMLRRLIGEDIDLVWLPCKNLWPVKVDPSQIDQILANLCVNARDAISGTGKVTIETGTTVLDEDYCAHNVGSVAGEYVLLAVSDDGCGMNKETLGKLFEPFFTTKQVGQGTGLGLATVYGIVKQNNGFINVYSEPGQGTTFKIYLPRHAAKTQQMQKEGPAEQVGRGHETILLVEDEPAILRMTTTMLERQGYKVLAASTPGEAIRLAEEYPGEIHLLITDVVMPEMNGRDLAKNILSLYPSLKRLFMSGYTANVIAHHGVLDYGVNFIQKPFSVKDLAIKVRDALR
jgi:two-component system cell cycle sensor histidine kinase/response regulator CckA